MFYFIYLIITTTANYTIDLAQANDNVKLAQLYLEGQYIDSLQHINVTEPELKNESNFLYQIWYNANYTMASVMFPYPGELIDPKVYEENQFPQDDESRLETKNYLDEWQSQTDANKSIILQTIAKFVGMGLMNQPVECIKQKQKKLIEINDNKKGEYDYLTPIPWQHVYMTEEQYKLSKFFAKAYEKNITIDEAFQNLPNDEQKEIYETYCRFFGIPIIIEPPLPPPSPPPPPAQPETDKSPLTKEEVLLIMILAVILSLSAYYIKILIQLDRFRQEITLDSLSSR